jgi:hypothetical protein
VNNKDKTGIYFDSIKHKKYLLAYDNGKLVSQSELMNEDDDKIHEDDKSLGDSGKGDTPQKA